MTRKWREWVQLLDDGVFRDGADCPEMVVIPAGEFMMGSPENEEGRYSDEGPQHRVKIARPFAVGKFPVTFDEWDACVAAGGCAHKPSDDGLGRGRRPVINVSWDDAQVYVAWLAKKTWKPYRLLSEAEWEYAARAGTTGRYPCGDEQWPLHVTNAFGLHDMIGNVWEWVQDCWNDSYHGAPADGVAREGNDSGIRVARGGCWVNNQRDMRVSVRGRIESAIRHHLVGLRVAMDMP